MPTVVLEAPGAAPACEGFEASALSSGGHGGRDFEAVLWTVADEDGRTLVDEARSGGDAGWASLALGADDAARLLNGSASRTVAVTVALANFLGGAANATVAVDVVGGTPPSLSLVGPRAFELARSEALVVDANGAATSCDGREAYDRAVDYAWAVYDAAGARVAAASDSKDPRQLSLPPRSLDVGVYDVVATATDAAYGESTNATATVTVVASALVAAIAGGDRVAAASASPLVLASESYDPDNLTAALDETWACDRNGTAVACGGGRVPVDVPGPVNVGLAVARGGRSAAAAVVVDVANITAPGVAVSARFDALVASDRAVVDGAVDVGEGAADFVAWTWRVARGALADGRTLEDVALAPLSGTAAASAAVGGVLAVGSLAVKPGAFVPGAAYGLALSASWAGLGDAAGSATLGVVASEPPSAGAVDVAPGSGPRGIQPLVWVVLAKLENSLARSNRSRFG